MTQRSSDAIDDYFAALRARLHQAESPRPWLSGFSNCSGTSPPSSAPAVMLANIQTLKSSRRSTGRGLQSSSSASGTKKQLRNAVRALKAAVLTTSPADQKPSRQQIM